MLAMVRSGSLAKPHSLLTEPSLLFDTNVAHVIQVGKHDTRRQSRSAHREALRKHSRMDAPFASDWEAEWPATFLPTVRMPRHQRRVFIGNACMGLLAHMRTTSVSKYSVSFGGIQH